MALQQGCRASTEESAEAPAGRVTVEDRWAHRANPRRAQALSMTEIP
eukprot:CAMPEP_0117688912 /NCGR_PEP_ID=MMETSP0804-20121206/24140_1 /TAXON_ID=1074897 /ORGANISM="Tetraselmis astigmatica, Strain CCMP880" /LENGTH=46 /DNA_ID= /DNA_START= /DNA_END= /DNA_ORIENTATION=